MTAYVITNKKDKEKHTKVLDSIQDARHWIINHLDLSKEWIIDVEYFDCISCSHEKNTKPNINCVDCDYNVRRMNHYHFNTCNKYYNHN